MNSDWVKQGEEVRREKRCRERGVVSLLCFHTDREVSFSPQRKVVEGHSCSFLPRGMREHLTGEFSLFLGVLLFRSTCPLTSTLLGSHARDKLSWSKADQGWRDYNSEKVEEPS